MLIKNDFLHKKILVITHSRNSLGYIIPASRFAKVLSTSGFDVVFACSKETVSIPQQLNLKVRTIFERPPMSRCWKDITTEETYRENVLKDDIGNPDYLKTCIEDEFKLFQEEAPDLVIHFFRFTSGVASSLLNIPCCSVLNLNIPIAYPLLLPIIVESLKNIGIENTHVNNILGEIVFAPDYSFFTPLSSLPKFLRSLIFNNVREIRYIGPFLQENPYNMPNKKELRDHLTNFDRKPFIYVSLGGTVNTSHVVIKILKNLTYRANYFITTGPNVNDSNWNIITDLTNTQNLNITTTKFTEDSVKYMKAADIAIVHGGQSTCFEALHCATPVIGIPGSEEQRANIQKLVHLHAGVLIEYEEIKTRLNREIEFLTTNDKTRKRVMYLAESMKRLYDKSDVIPLLSQFLII